jgi:hypothetical protein
MAKFKITRTLLKTSPGNAHFEFSEKMRCPECFAYGSDGVPKAEKSHNVMVFKDGHRGDYEYVTRGYYSAPYRRRGRPVIHGVNIPTVYVEGRGPDDVDHYEKVIDVEVCPACHGVGSIEVGVVLNMAAS